jgi:hypothetical protein
MTRSTDPLPEVTKTPCRNSASRRHLPPEFDRRRPHDPPSPRPEEQQVIPDPAHEVILGGFRLIKRMRKG